MSYFFVRKKKNNYLEEINIEIYHLNFKVKREGEGDLATKRDLYFLPIFFVYQIIYDNIFGSILENKDKVEKNEYIIFYNMIDKN